MTELSHELNREVSLLIDRRGRVITVSVGDAAQTEFPASERTRGGEYRLRGLRLVHTHIRPGPLSKSDLSTLFLNRLDAIVAIDVTRDGLPGTAHLAHLTPPNAKLEEEDWRIYPAQTIASLEHWDVLAQSEALEEEFARAAQARETKRTSSERAILVAIDTGSGLAAEEQLQELAELARTAGAEVVYKTLVYRKHRSSGRSLGPSLIGGGKLEELRSRAYHADADLLIFGQDLSPTQVRDIEAATALKVIDRTQLILDIFAQHARGQESQLQVELAQLRYMLPRLIGASGRLSKIGGSGSGGGGVIGTRGPGETKLELDRRRIGERITFLERNLREMSKRQLERRKARKRNLVPVIAIVGYTNAGKSTLLNALTRANVLAEDKLFATLAPSSKRGFLANLRHLGQRTALANEFTAELVPETERWIPGSEVIFTDTVGFIRDLPRDLKRAFRSTLEELGDADLLLHVLDVSTPGSIERLEAVEAILEELELSNMPQLIALNKIDRVSISELAQIKARFPEAIELSAATGQGIDALKLELARCLGNAPSPDNHQAIPKSLAFSHTD